MFTKKIILPVNILSWWVGDGRAKCDLICILIV